MLREKKNRVYISHHLNEGSPCLEPDSTADTPAQQLNKDFSSVPEVLKKTFVDRHRMPNSCRCLVLLLAFTAIILMANGQRQHNSRSTSLRSMSQVRTATTSTTSMPFTLEAEDRISTDFEPRPSLTIQPEDRLKLRQSVMDLNKRRRVTAIKPTMSPDVISTPNVYHFFSKKRFERVRSNLTVTTSQPPTSSTVESAPTSDVVAA
ncbi:uncharacterized protein LOC130689315 isoform X1 [Daphnia carinata]|uniref:uncharacterized protein LOC130689315 isoform X1 n=1 Tax=Daphnia carinata TaxID=120202 RepID=UPI002868DBA8|nr:uncharacterized protein LOC130689315 isoform X1 [Daphnia carinata]